MVVEYKPKEKKYLYCHPNGEKYCEVVRRDMPDGKKKIYTVPSGLEGPHPLYRAERLAKLPPETVVYIVEGEKCVEALEWIGLTATTSKGGSCAADKTGWKTLAKFGKIVMLPNADESGKKYAEDVVSILHTLDGIREVVICELPGLDNAENVVNFLERAEVKLDEEAKSGPKAQHDLLLEAIEQHGKLSNSSEVELGERDEPFTTTTLLREFLPPKPYPVEALGGLAPAVESVAKVLGVPPSMAANGFLAGVALAVQKHGDISIDERRIPLNMYFFTVADTGDRKSAVDAVALKPHRDWMRIKTDHYKQQMGEYELQCLAYQTALRKVKSKGTKEEIYAAMKEVGDRPQKPLAPVLVVSDMTAEGLHKVFADESSSCGLFSDEGGVLIGGYSMSTEQQLKTCSYLSGLWTGRAELRTRSGNGLTYTDGKRFSMHMMCQPEVAGKLYSSQIVNNQGFMARLLTVWPDSLRGTRTYKREGLSSDKHVELYNERVTLILEHPTHYSDSYSTCLDPRLISLSPKAYEMYVNFYNEVEAKNFPGGHFDCIAGWSSKAAEHALRIAGVLSLYEDLEGECISETQMSNGITLTKYYMHEMRRVHAKGEHREELLRAERLLQFMRKKAPENNNDFSKKYLLQCGPSSIRDAITLKDTLSVLSREDLVEPISEGDKRWSLKCQ